MKILHIVFSFKYGGIETMLVNIVNEQIQHTQVSIIIINDNYEQSLLDRIDKKVQIIKIGRPLKSKNLFYIFKLNYLIKKISPSIIHSHNSSIIKYLCPFFRNIAVNTIHDTPNSTHFSHIRSYREIFAISKSVQNNLKEKRHDSYIVENGIQPDNFLKKEHHQASPIFKIVQIGRLEHYKKGQDILIKACSLLTNNKAATIHIDFIGEGDSKDYLIGLVKEYNLNSYISFLGSKDTHYIEQHLKDYDLLVQPSRIEGFGLTVAEAMAAKVPVLVSGQEGPMEIINHGEYGFYFNNNDEHDLANKIIEIVHLQESQIEIMVNKALKRVQEHYNIKRTANKYLEHYKNLH